MPRGECGLNYLDCFKPVNFCFTLGMLNLTCLVRFRLKEHWDIVGKRSCLGLKYLLIGLIKFPMTKPDSTAVYNSKNLFRGLCCTSMHCDELRQLLHACYKAAVGSECLAGRDENNYKGTSSIHSEIVRAN